MPDPIITMDMSFPEYLADPAPEPSLTSSLARALMTKTPRRVWWETRRLNPNAPAAESADRFDIGTAAHAMFVGRGEPIEWVDATDWRSNAAKEVRYEAWAAGQTPILAWRRPAIEAMADEMRRQISAEPELAWAAEGGHREATICWPETTFGFSTGSLWCRARPDIWSPDHGMIVHYKTTQADMGLHELARYAANLGWGTVAAHYTAASDATLRRCRQIFALQEQTPPHDVVFIELDPAFVEAADMLRERAMKVWRECVETGNWPGRPTGILPLSPPGWHEDAVIAAKDAYEAARGDTGLLERWRDWQAPNDGGKA